MFVGALAVAAIVSTTAGARTQPAVMPAINMSSKAGVAKFLTSHGIDLKGIVIQRGAHNYAGPSCPGVGWTCTTAKHVVQVSFRGNDSEFQCTPSTGGSSTSPDTCTIVQVSSGGRNDARCTERTRAASASQSCVIYQTNTTGDNHLEIKQEADANGGAAQDATQYAGTIQQNGSGENDAEIQQDTEQSTKDTDATGLQTQNGHQGVSVTQSSDSGDNSAHVHQSLAQDAKALGLNVSQNQNTNASGPNTNAGITQNSNTGRNDARLNQSNDLNGTVAKTSNGSQTQGSPSGGINGFFSQNSGGVSTVRGNQHEQQNLNIDGGGNGHENDGHENGSRQNGLMIRADSRDKNGGKDDKGGKDDHGKKPPPPPPPPPRGVVTQTQYGPLDFDPNQGSNLNDTYDLNQFSEQHASKPTLQDDKAFAECFTTGHCAANQRISQQGQNFSNSCSGTSCNIGTRATNGDGSTCGGPNTEGGCDVSFPPPPPPPPVQGGCEFGCETSPSATVVTSSQNPSYGGTVTFTATVTPSAATGTVTFTDGNATLCANVPLAQTDGGKQASCAAPSLSIGTHVITGTYSGDSTYSGSSGTVTQDVQLG